MNILNYDEVPAYLLARNDPATNTAYVAFKRQELDAMVFNTFVFFQIFNEINCRRLDNNLNIFAGAIKNRYFSVIFVIMVILQILIIEFGGAAFKTQRLDGIQWLICVLLGLLSIPVGVIIRLTPDGIFGGIKAWVNNSGPVQSGLPNFESFPATHEMGRVNSIPISIGSHHRANSLTGSAHNNVYPSRDGLVWNSAITKVRSELSVFKSIRGGRLSTDSERERTHVLHAGAMVPSLVATSVGAGWQPHRVRDITPSNSSSQVNIQSSPRSSMTSSRRGTGVSARASTPPPAASSSSSAPVNNLTSQPNLSGTTLPIS